MKKKPNRCSTKSVSSSRQAGLALQLTVHHLQWAESLAGKFRPKNNLRWIPEDLVHVLSTWRFSLFLRNIIRRHGSQVTSTSIRSVVNNFFSQKATMLTRTATALSEVAHGRELRQFRTDAPSSMRQFQTWNLTKASFPRGTAVTYRPQIVPENSTRSSFPLYRSPAVATGQLHRQVRMEYVISIGLSVRHAEQWRRVEDPMIATRSDLAHGDMDRRFTPDFVLELPRSAIAKEIQAIPGNGPAAQSTVPAAVGVMELTDEVMRQLDRRLIATRERMGKI